MEKIMFDLLNINFLLWIAGNSVLGSPGRF